MRGNINSNPNDTWTQDQLLLWHCTTFDCHSEKQKNKIFTRKKSWEEEGMSVARNGNHLLMFLRQQHELIAWKNTENNPAFLSWRTKEKQQQKGKRKSARISLSICTEDLFWSFDYFINRQVSNMCWRNCRTVSVSVRSPCNIRRVFSWHWIIFRSNSSQWSLRSFPDKKA